MKSKFYFVKCLTNLHMGSGDINFNVVDNEVQRDPVTGYPTMFSSGIKGALREHFESNHSELTVDIFGSALDKKKSDESQPGNLRFLTANMLLLPVRASAGSKLYYLVTTKTILRDFATMYETVNGRKVEFAEALQKLEANKAYAAGSMHTAGIDGIEYSGADRLKPIPDAIVKFFKTVADTDKLLIVPDQDARTLSLPVSARNQLDNGISKNLWYEEVVPHESVFYLAVLSNGTETGDKALDSFDKAVKTDRLFQFGGNATIGYGLTMLEEF